MTTDRVNELRAIVRANRPLARDDSALHAAVARQEAAMRANRETYPALLERTATVDSEQKYKAFACGRTCHPDRYTVVTTRTLWGRKRWGIRDNHMGVNLSRLCTSAGEAELWRIRLATMEMRERQHADRATEK